VNPSFPEFVDDGSLLNEFAMMWALRERFPLHLIVFKQTVCHLSHEAIKSFPERDTSQTPIWTPTCSPGLSELSQAQVDR